MTSATITHVDFTLFFLTLLTVETPSISALLPQRERTVISNRQRDHTQTIGGHPRCFVATHDGRLVVLLLLLP